MSVCNRIEGREQSLLNLLFDVSAQPVGPELKLRLCVFVYLCIVHIVHIVHCAYVH